MRGIHFSDLYFILLSSIIMLGIGILSGITTFIMTSMVFAVAGLLLCKIAWSEGLYGPEAD